MCGELLGSISDVVGHEAHIRGEVGLRVAHLLCCLSAVLSISQSN